jgi:hypothetical protein
VRPGRRLSLRTRITVVATLGIAVALSALAVGLGARLHRDLVHQLDGQLEADATLITSRSATPTARNLSSGPPDRLAQVVDRRGAVVTTSANTTTPIVAGAWPWPLGSGPHLSSRVDPARGHLRVLVAPIGPQGDQWLVVARSQDQVVHATESTTRGLLVAVPLLTVVLGAVT